MVSNYSACIIQTMIIAVVGLGCGAQKVLTEKDNIPAFYVDADGSNETLKADTLRNPFPHLLMR